MKFNFRKISAISMSLLMTGLTAGVVAAADYPAPFVVDGAANVAVVYGANSESVPAGTASALDMVDASSIQSNLNLGVTTTGATTTIAGDNIKLEKGSNLFNLGENTSIFYSSMDDSELSFVLAEGVYRNDNNDEFEYTQDIVLGELVLEHFLESDFNDDKPVIGFNLDSGDFILNYTLDFSDHAEGTDVDFSDIDDTTIEILGKEYYISEAEYTSSDTMKLTLLDSANTITLGEGETKDVNLGETPYAISINWMDDDEVRFEINGELVPATDKLIKGQSYKLLDGTYVSVLDVSKVLLQGETGQVTFSLGSGKIELEDGEEVQFNDEEISDDEFADQYGYTSEIIAHVTNSSTDLTEITLEWNLADEAWIDENTELVMPGFEAIKFYMGGFVTPLEEVTTLDDSSEEVQIKTTVEEGELQMSILYSNGTTGFGGIGVDVDELLVTSSTANPTLTLNESEKSYFVATWIDGDEAETYAFEFSINSDEETTFKSLVTGGSNIDDVENATSENIGNEIDVAVTADDSTKIATIVLSAASSGNVYADRIVTKEGLQMMLPVDTNTSLTNFNEIDLTISGVDQTSWIMNFQEEDDNEAIGGGLLDFNVTFGVDESNSGTEPSSTSVTTHESEDGSDLDVGYVVSVLATKLEFNRPSSGLNDLKITYHGSETYGEVYIAESGAVTTITEGGAVLVLDSEVSNVATKNLIIVGGSCINTAAAALVGAGCGETWVANTGIEAGQFLIKGFADSTITSKLAVLVAGYNQEDTANAVTYLITEKPDTSGDWTGTSATEAALTVTADNSTV